MDLLQILISKSIKTPHFMDFKGFAYDKRVTPRHLIHDTID